MTTQKNNPLNDALGNHPLVFEIRPPIGEKDRASLSELARKTSDQLKSTGRLNGINIPEIADENHEGKPWYRTRHNPDIAKLLEDSLGIETIVNKSVAYLQDQEFRKYIEETRGLFGLRNFTVVGPNTSARSYPGLSVPDATRIAKHMLSESNGLVGNVSIPQRVGEPDRMLKKTIAGTDFFTTQLIFEPEGVHISRLIEYARLCEEAGVKPAAVLLSFAPLLNKEDYEFYVWLGAELSEDTARRILKNDGKDAVDNSVQNAQLVYINAKRRLKKAGKFVPVGVNVGEVRPGHGTAPVTMLNSFADLLRNGTDVSVALEHRR